jgi:DNA-binding transcriptional LysR family regulator
MIPLHNLELCPVDTRKLLHFTETVDQGSITKAARALRVSQPALTKSLRLLENELNVKLLVRTSAGVTMTEFGRSLYAHARAVAAEIEHARAEIRQLSGIGKAFLKIGVLPSVSSTLFARAIAKFAATMPDLSIHVHEGVHYELMSAIRRREYDFVIAMADRFEPDPDPALRYRIILRDQLRIVARVGHPLDGQETVTCADLIKFPWVHPVVGTAHRPILSQLFKESGIQPPHAQMECASVQFAKTVMTASDALGLMPAHTMEPEMRAGTLCCLPIVSEHLQRSVGIYYSIHRPPTPAARSVMREVERICSTPFEGHRPQPVAAKP